MALCSVIVIAATSPPPTQTPSILLTTRMLIALITAAGLRRGTDGKPTRNSRKSPMNIYDRFIRGPSFDSSATSLSSSPPPHPNPPLPNPFHLSPGKFPPVCVFMRLAESKIAFVATRRAIDVYSARLLIYSRIQTPRGSRPEERERESSRRFRKGVRRGIISCEILRGRCKRVRATRGSRNFDQSGDPPRGHRRGREAIPRKKS